VDFRAPEPGEAMISVRPIWTHTIEEAARELERTGFSPAQAEKLAVETVPIHLRVEGVPGHLILSLKKIAHAAGTRLLIPPSRVNRSEKQDLILLGTPSQLQKLAVIFEKEPSELYTISKELRSSLSNIGTTRFTIACRGQPLTLGERTLVMGAINVTPDSFSDGGVFFHRDRAVARALEMVEEGVDILDIGGESTRPRSKAIDPDEERLRVIPVIKRIAAKTNIPISVDTRKAQVAREALEAGGQIINDISALRSDPEMAEVIASYQAAVVLMHMRGTPETMQQDIHYGSLISDIIQYLKQSIDLACKAGVKRERIILDPGIGFGKTVEHNLSIIKDLYQFRILGRPILIGTSRKSFIGNILNLDTDQREEGTMASVTAAILNGAHVVRVHNVRNAVRVARIADAIQRASLSNP
jgi:dihydropteroate synthase